MAIGYLMMQARTAHDAVPLAGVHVRVLDDQGNGLYDLITDENGETQRVPLETLPAQFSQNQYFSGLPYVSYNVLAQAQGFNTLYVSSIPIYENETAVLPLALLPMQQLQRRALQEKIFVGKPAVAMQESRNMQGSQDNSIQQSSGLQQMNGTQQNSGLQQMNGAQQSSVLQQMNRMQQISGLQQNSGLLQSGNMQGNGIQETGSQGEENRVENSNGNTFDGNDSRVLRQVVIPNPITVHLGAPGSYAQNVQVSFPDYVKNVASSEIYPTWPEASLTANIYAIITFALNRVYTEWYRSKGYDYDITNSTAYDQNFVYGRPIYDSISKIVDNIFNEYVRRQGQTAPYFTSFCNGTTVTCQGMSQWGTVTLANGGLTPLQILRRYYPNDVEIASTNIITGELSSYPGSPLKVGSTGLDVETIQTYLGRIRRNYPAIPAITDPAGTFGESTKNAVVKFQNIFGLTADGIVGKSTWFKLSSL